MHDIRDNITYVLLLPFLPSIPIAKNFLHAREIHVLSGEHFGIGATGK